MREASGTVNKYWFDGCRERVMLSGPDTKLRMGAISGSGTTRGSHKPISRPQRQEGVSTHGDLLADKAMQLGQQQQHIGLHDTPFEAVTHLGSSARRLLGWVQHAVQSPTWLSMFWLAVR